MRKILQFSLPF
jgi:hypothetical protein